MNLSEKIRPSFTLSDDYNEWMEYIDVNGIDPQNQASRIIVDSATELLSRII